MRTRTIVWETEQYGLARDTEEGKKAEFAVVLFGTHTEIKVATPEDASRIFQSLIRAETEVIQ